MLMLTIFLAFIIYAMQLQATSTHQIRQDAELLTDTSVHHMDNPITHLLYKHFSNRSLQSFSTLNSIFNEITLVLPDSSISSNGLDLTITELTCSDLNVQDIQVGHTSLSDTTTRLAVNVIGLEVTCNFRWSYKWTIFNGSGSGKALLDPSSWASVNLDFISQDYNEYPPKDVNINDCSSAVEIGDLQFDGDGLGFIASIINAFERLMRDRIEGEIDTTVCSELKGLGDGALDDILIKLSAQLDDYLNPLPVDMQDPLSLESSIDVPRDENGTSLYLNFLELEEYAGDWINSALNKLDSFLGGSESNGELGVNSMIRDNFLNEDGEFLLNPLDFMTSNVIFESHDMLTETSMSIVSIAIRGLDTFTELDLMNAIGNHTLKNSLKLKELSLVVSMTAFMKASSKSNAVISAPNSEPIEENFSVTVALKDINIDFSVMLALNTETLGNMELGPLLSTETITQCLMAAAEHMSFTELSISVLNVVPPTLTGFLDTGIDKIISKGAGALFDMYESVLLKAMPNFFQSFVRERLNKFVKNSLQLLTVCTESHTLSGLLDFRDLLLSPDVALTQGGSGRSPYGNVVNFLWDLVQEQLFTADDSGLLAMNGMLVRPLTKAQSGEEGLLSFNQTLVNLEKEVNMDIWKAFADNLRLGISNLRIAGLDTFSEPFHPIKPSSESGHVLQNHIRIGNENKSLDVAFQFDIEVGGLTSPLETSNALDLQLRIPPIEIIADMLAAVDSSKFMPMPLKNVLNVDCWLSMMMHTEKLIIDGSKRSSFAGLAMQRFDAFFDDFTAQSSCVSCSNKALENFDEIMAFLSENGFFSSVKERGIKILTEIFESEYVDGILDNIIRSAAFRCDEKNDALAPQLDNTKFQFEASRQLVDGIVYGAMIVSQTIAVVLAQKHKDLDIAEVDTQLEVPSDARLIDLTNLTSIASWADAVLDEANTYLGSRQQNANGDEGLGIVNILQSVLLDENGLLTIPIRDQGFEAGGVVLSVYNVTLIGLDSFSSFDVLKINGPHGFGNTARLDTLGVSVEMGLATAEDSELETITASLMLKEIGIDVSLLIAIDQDILGGLKLGSVMDTDRILLCILTAIHAVGLPEFIMNIGDIDSFTLEGFTTDKTNRSIKNFTDALFQEYEDLVLDAIPAFTMKTVGPLLHNIFQVLIDMAKDGQCPTLDVNEKELVDFRDLFLSPALSKELNGSGESPYGNLFQMLFSFIEEMATKTTKNGLSIMNDVLISRFTDNGDIHWEGEVFSRNVDIALNGLNADISLAIKDVKMENLNTIASPMRILQPIYDESNILNNSASIGVGDPLRVSFNLFVSGEGDELEVKNELELGLSLSNADVILELLAAMKEVALLNFPLRDITNINCWLSAIKTPVLDKYGIRFGDKTMALDHMVLGVKEAQLDINCISCSSPVLLEMSSFFSSSKGVEDTTRVTNMLLKYGSNLLMGDYVQNTIDKFLNEAALKCPHSQSYNPNINGIKYESIEARTVSASSYGFLWAILSVVCSMTVCAACIAFAVKHIKKRRHARWLEQLSQSQIIQLVEEERQDAMRQDDINHRMYALAFSDHSIPKVLRFGMPVLILGNIALFLSGHLSLGGTVNISGQFAGQSFDVQGFFEFSMVNSTIEMWEAGAYSLAILIAIFSGLWPYCKTLTLLGIWFVPTHRLSSRRRGQILHWLDVLGKWSMVDVFVLLLSIASFRISLDSPSHLEFLPDGLFSIHMMVIPLWGLYANMLAQIISQISSHIIIHYHRKTEAVALRAQQIDSGIDLPDDENVTDVLRQHKFKLDYEASTKYAIVTQGVSSLFAAISIVIVVLVISGCFMTSFSIETVGLLGLAVESMNQFQDAIIYYSVFDLATMMMGQARYLNTPPNYIGLGTLSSLLVVTVFIVPVAQSISLSLKWFRPMNKRRRHRNFVINEMLSAWQYMEVYVLSVVIAAWQLGGVSEYMINAYCESLQDLFNTLSFYGILNENDAQCFRVNASVETGTYLLVAASIILSFMNHFVMSASSQRHQDVTTPSDRRLHSDRFIAEKETMSLDEDEVEQVASNYEANVIIAPVPSRFTDLYAFATSRHDYSDGTSSTLSAVVGSNEKNSSSIEASIEIETAKAFWDVPLDKE